MKELLNSISSSDLVTITIIMSVIALLLAIAISIEIYRNYIKTSKIKSAKIDSNTINIKEVDGIKYVDEDDEMEKTKARIELTILKEKLKQEEAEKQKLIELNLELAKKNQIEENKNPEVNKIEEKEKKIKIEVQENHHAPSIEKQEEVIENNISTEILDDEESAIISFDELKNIPNTSIDEDGSVKYQDEDTAVISIMELEKLYKESLNINTVKEEKPKEVELMTFDIKKVEDLPKIKDYNDFQNTPFISPVHGLTQTENDIILTSTANLERLNKEIKKTNEFLQALKVLKKNLE